MHAGKAAASQLHHHCHSPLAESRSGMRSQTSWPSSMPRKRASSMLSINTLPRAIYHGTNVITVLSQGPRPGSSNRGVVEIPREPAPRAA